MRLGQPENQYFAPDGRPITKDEANRFSSAWETADLPRERCPDASSGLRTDLTLQLSLLPIFTNNAPERFEFWSLGFLQRFSLGLLFSKADLAAGFLNHLTGAVSER